jgi:HSP20 family protein
MQGLSLREWAPPSLRSLFRSWEDPSAMPTLFEEQDFPVDVSRNGDGEVVVRATLPGFKKEEIDLSLDNNTLKITAQHNEESETGNENYYRRERAWKSASRTIALPGQAKEDGVNAELKDGVLTVRVPQTKEARARAIKIH